MVRRWHWDLPESWELCLLTAVFPWDSTKESEATLVFVCPLYTPERMSFKCCQPANLNPGFEYEISATVFNGNLHLRGSALHHACHTPLIGVRRTRGLFSSENLNSDWYPKVVCSYPIIRDKFASSVSSVKESIDLVK